MDKIDFPHRPNGYEFINWLYCPECGSKAGMHRYSPRFELMCSNPDCDEEMELVLGVTPPFHKVTPHDIEAGVEAEQDSVMPFQSINLAKKMRELGDEDVADELERAGYTELADELR